MYISIELGAGRGRFGNKFFPPCLETDAAAPNLRGCDVDALMDAHAAACSDNQFSVVLLCNPHPYGFVREDGLELLREMVRIMVSTGRAILIASSHNPNCQPKRIKKAADALCAATGTELLMTVTAIHAKDRYPGHTFYRLDGSPTVPNVEIVLTMKGSDHNA